MHEAGYEARMPPLRVPFTFQPQEPRSDPCLLSPLGRLCVSTAGNKHGSQAQTMMSHVERVHSVHHLGSPGFRGHWSPLGEDTGKGEQQELPHPGLTIPETRVPRAR